MHEVFFEHKRLWRWLVSAGAGMALAASVAAQSVPADGVSKQSLPEAALSAEVSAQVPQDTVRITLAHEVDDASREAVAKSLSTVLDKVLAQAKGNEKVRASSGNYRVWPHTDKEGKISNWRGRAEVLLESQDFPAAAELASALGAHMPIAGLSFSVSDKARRDAEAELLEQAAQAFRARAAALAQAFGYRDYEIRSIELGGGGAPIMPRFARASVGAAEAGASVPLEGGVETISLNVQGSIVLSSAEK